MSRLHERQMKRFAAAGLYVVTSRDASAGRSTLSILEAVLVHGVRLIQIREKNLCKRDLLALALKARELTARAGALLIINDHLDVALAAGADGVHLGQEDLPVNVARRLAGDFIIGASATNLKEAREAEKLGASYVNVGPVYATQTKTDLPVPLGLAAVREVARSVRIPFTVMGGIQARHVRELVAAGARTLAVISAVTGAPEPGRAAA